MFYFRRGMKCRPGRRCNGALFRNLAGVYTTSRNPSYLAVPDKRAAIINFVFP